MRYRTKSTEKEAILPLIVRRGGNGQMAIFGLELDRLRFEYSVIHLCDLCEEWWSLCNRVAVRINLLWYRQWNPLVLYLGARFDLRKWTTWSEGMGCSIFKDWGLGRVGDRSWSPWLERWYVQAKRYLEGDINFTAKMGGYPVWASSRKSAYEGEILEWPSLSFSIYNQLVLRRKKIHADDNQWILTYSMSKILLFYMGKF